jgi:hypothetical protein
MSNAPHEPLNYVSPNTLAWRIECIAAPDGLTINTRPPTARMLWREALMPAIAIGLLGAVIFGALAHAWRMARSGNPADAAGWSLVHVVVIAGAALGLVISIRDARQNAGIVTQIEVRGREMRWTKRNRWGVRDYAWPAETIRDVTVVPAGLPNQFILKVLRRQGWPLGAFSFYPQTELEPVAAALRQALHAAGAPIGW